MSAAQVAQVRRFNRLVTHRAGALDDHFLGRDRPLGESRLLYEIGPRGADVRQLRARLGLDSGYLSRLLRSLVSRGLVALGPAAGDRRVQRARLTRAGAAEVRLMNRRSDRDAAALLGALTAGQRDRLVSAMAEVERLMRAASAEIERVAPTGREARWCVSQYFAELAARFERGFDPAASLPADDADLVPPRGAFLVARIDGEPVACGAIKSIGRGVASIKRMWVAESVRGTGFGRRMLEALEAEASRLRLRTLRLETNRSLTEAIRLYRSAGYREVPAFNDDPYADHWFEKRLR